LTLQIHVAANKKLKGVALIDQKGSVFRHKNDTSQ